MKTPLAQRLRHQHWLRANRAHVRAYARRYNHAHREQRAAYMKTWRAEHPDRVAVYESRRRPVRFREKARRWGIEKFRARDAVKYALHIGRLVKKACERCGAERTHAHHDDYRKRLQVRWLCSPCHWLAHR